MSTVAKPRGRVILKKNKNINRIWHPDSTLVFKSATEKVVIGRYDGKEIISLDDESLELCTKWNFKYDTTLIENVEEVTASEEEGDEQSDESKEEREDEEDQQKDKEEEEQEQEHEEEEQEQEQEDDEEDDEEEEEEEEKEKQQEEEEEEEEEEDKEEKIVRKVTNTFNLDESDKIFNDHMSNTTLFFDKIKDLLNETSSNLNNSLNINETLSQELNNNKDTLKTVQKELEDTKKELEDTKTKMSNIKKLLGGI